MGEWEEGVGRSGARLSYWTVEGKRAAGMVQPQPGFI